MGLHFSAVTASGEVVIPSFRRRAGRNDIPERIALLSSSDEHGRNVLWGGSGADRRGTPITGRRAGASDASGQDPVA